MATSKEQAAVTFESLGVHAQVCAALAEKGITVPLEFQRKTLLHTVHDFADIIAETTTAHSGRHTLLAIIAAHCVLYAANDEAASAQPGKRSVLLVANNTSTCAKMMAVVNSLSSCGVAAVLCVEDRPPQNLPSSASAGVVYIGTLTTFGKWSRDAFPSMVSLLVEDAAHHDSKNLQLLMETLIQSAPSANLFLLSSQPPSNVSVAIRYLLRRKNRRYYFNASGNPHYTFLLCHDADDRSDLNMRVTQMKGLKSVLILTHNREVRELKALLHQQLGFKTFSIQRSTAAGDHDRVLSDFLRSSYAVLVAMDAYTGVDLMDVDAVIQYYPPQKSMPEEEWAEYISYLQTTNNPAKPTLIVTLVGTDDFALTSYFMRRVGVEGPVLNLTPLHTRFADIVRNPDLVLAEKSRFEHGELTSNVPLPRSKANETPSEDNERPGPVRTRASGAPTASRPALSERRAESGSGGNRGSGGSGTYHARDPPRDRQEAKGGERNKATSSSSKEQPSSSSNRGGADRERGDRKESSGTNNANRRSDARHHR